MPYIANPSPCLAVMTMYFIPASSAIFTHRSALNSVGLNCPANDSYSFTGIGTWAMIHSLLGRTGLPFHSPAGMAYSPQWMNRPYLA